MESITLPIKTIQINDREEVLVVVKDTGTMKNKVTSFYPSCTVSQLNRIATTLKNGKDLRKVIKRNMFLTRIWNVVGSCDGGSDDD